MSEPRKQQISLLGVSGYAGQVMHELCIRHPGLAVRCPTARTPADASPELLRQLADSDAVLLCLPEDAAHAWAEALLAAGARRVLDLSGAHRQQDGIHYGIPELFGAPDPAARLVANPGCYPTATLLLLRPLLAAGLIERDCIAVVGASGASGAGKGLRDDLHFSELHDNFFPYKVGEHRHSPEIERHLGTAIDFVTELLPVVRGILITAFVRPRAEPAALRLELERFHAGHPYVTVLEQPGPGNGIRHVIGTHQCVLSVGPKSRSGLLPLFSSIDNLMRGAASQALHNLNLWLGLPAELGLPAPLAHAPAGVPGMTRAIP